MNAPFPYHYICIEGNIGSGKTSFCDLFANQFPVELILEEFSGNPFLPYFYENPGRYALPVELFFLTERYKQLSAHFQTGHLFTPVVLSDYFFDKSRLFARNNLDELEFKLFTQIYETLAPRIPKPDIVLYLHKPVDQLKENIRKRGRKIEQDISSNYLHSLQNVYFEYFRIKPDFPIVIVNTENLRFTESNDDFQRLIGLLEKKYTNGIHRVSFVH